MGKALGTRLSFANIPLRIIYKNSVISHFLFSVSLYRLYVYCFIFIHICVSYLPFHHCHLIYSVYAQFWPWKQILIYTLSEPNIYKPYGFFLGFLTTLLLRIPVVLSFIHCGKINWNSETLLCQPSTFGNTHAAWLPFRETSLKIHSDHLFVLTCIWL